MHRDTYARTIDADSSGLIDGFVLINARKNIAMFIFLHVLIFLLVFSNSTLFDYCFIDERMQILFGF